VCVAGTSEPVLCSADLRCLVSGAGYAGEQLYTFTTGWMIALIVSVSTCGACVLGGNVMCHYKNRRQRLSSRSPDESSRLLGPGEREGAAKGYSKDHGNDEEARVLAMELESASDQNAEEGGGLRAWVASKVNVFLQGSLPPVTGLSRRMLVLVDMLFSYTVLAISTTLDIHIILALWHLPAAGRYVPTLLSGIPAVHLYAFYILAINVFRLMAASYVIPFQLLMRPSLVLGFSKVCGCLGLCVPVGGLTD
jgi:hypothetical protein